MTLTDSGPIIAIADVHDKFHPVCKSALLQLTTPLITTYPALTEAMYFLGSRIGWRAQQAIWTQISTGLLLPADLVAESLYRMEDLMAKYSDTPMDFADASLVALAEQRKINRIFTIDDHFRIYQLHGREPFDVIPDAG